MEPKTRVPAATARRLTLVAAIALGACAPDLKAIKTASGDPCELTIGQETMFVGEAECFRALESQTMSGYVVIGLEYSAFYKQRSAVPKGYDGEATWLSFSDEARRKVKALERPVDVQVFQLTFVGVDPGRLGVYGHNGSSKHGIFAERILDIKEVKDMEQWIAR